MVDHHIDLWRGQEQMDQGTFSSSGKLSRFYHSLRGSANPTSTYCDDVTMQAYLPDPHDPPLFQ
jgi:hypothetical protein